METVLAGVEIKQYIKLVACSFVLLTLFSCHFNPNVQGRGSAALQGVWLEKEVPYQDKLLQYTRYQLRFTCDSVYMVMRTTAKVNQYPQQCFHQGRWEEYARGTYTCKQDTLLINATFTQKNYRQKLSGCYRIGQYLPVFIIKKQSGNSLYLQNVLEPLPIQLTLQQKITCRPQPL